MKILAIDTATEACSAAVLCHSAAVLCRSAAVLCRSAAATTSPAGSSIVVPELLVCRYEEPGRGHAERILTLVSEVLAEAKLTLSTLDAIAFGRGPGAFTGVRLAASVAQGLAYGARLRVVPVSDLRALAQRALDTTSSTQSVLACMDARMHEVYWACFRRGVAGLAEPYPASAERVDPPDRVRLADGMTGPILGVGRGFTAHPQLEERLQAQLAAVQHDLLPRAREIARLAAVDLEEGRSVAPQEALPVYLRDEVARPPS